MTLLSRRVDAQEANLAAHRTVVEGLVKDGVDCINLIEVDYLNAGLRAELEFVKSLIEDIKSGRLHWRPTGGTDRTNGEWE